MKIYSAEAIKRKLQRRKTGKKILYAILWVLVVFAVICAGTVLVQKFILKRKYVGLFGCASFIVSSGSMQPSLQVNDIVVVKKVSGDHLSQGDIISFFDKSGNVVTHRVAEVVMRDGGSYCVTKGDANNANDVDPVSFEDIIGRYRFKISGGGYIVAAVTSPVGIVFFILLVILICLIVYRKGRRKAARHSVRERYKKQHVVQKEDTTE